ncbi:MAG: glutathione S-transferase N-terminal domain-containing protein [Burkholderiales bacterium]
MSSQYAIMDLRNNDDTLSRRGDNMRLIIARPSPYSRKVRVAMLEKGCDCELVIDNPWLSETRVAEANPLGKVPALLLDDGTVVHDSRVIIEYLETLGMPPVLVPDEPRQHIAHKQIEAIADGVCDAVVQIVIEGTRPADKRSDVWLMRQRKKVIGGIAELERLLDGGETFTECGFGLAEIATICALDYVDLRYPDYQWRGHAPGLLDLYERLSARPSFANTRPQPQPLPGL